MTPQQIAEAEALASVIGAKADGTVLGSFHSYTAATIRSLTTALTEAQDRAAELEEACRHIDALDPEGQIGGCSQDAIRGLVLRMGGIARAALANKETDDV